MTTVTITVTAAHIAAGKRYECGDCPVAIAAAEVFGGTAYVDITLIVMTGDGTETEFTLPDEALAFITAFDDAKPVAPFTFIAEEVTAA
jgi:hypothetical protein